MKKLLFTAFSAIALFVSCTMSDTDFLPIVETPGDFTARLEETRTELNGNAVVWCEEDLLTIFTKTAHNRKYQVKELSDDRRLATFGYLSYTGNNDTKITSNYALYPYDADATLADGVVTTTLQATQTYNGTNGNLGYALMAARSTDNNFSFLNAGSLLRFKVSKNSHKVHTLQAIKVASASNNIAGEVTIDLGGSEMKAVVTSNGVKEITLADINYELTTDIEEFYIAMPSMSFADKDLTVTFVFEDDEDVFELPAFDLKQGKIKNIAYKISSVVNFVGSTPGSYGAISIEDPTDEPTDDPTDDPADDDTEDVTDNSIAHFRFLRTVNPILPKDVEMTIAGDSIVGFIPSLDVGMTSLIPTFSVSNSAQVYVSNVLQTSGQTKQNFTKRVKYTVVAPNGNEREYTVALHRFTGLPILYINTNSGGEIASKEVWEGATYRLDGGLNYESIPETTLQVKGRGNSSWNTFLKKRSYNMKLEKRTSVCGMPKHKRWCLIGNYRDKTLLRNQVAMELGRVTQLEWVPRGVQVELVKNGTHRGTYLLSEQIRIDENRVNIQELHKDDVQSEAITGGYVLEVDRYGDSDTYSFYSKYMTGTIYEADSKSLVHVKIPSIEDGNDAQFKYIESHFRKAEEAICNNKGDWTEALSTYIDLSSIIDQWLIYEITATPEPARGPYSFYMYKKQGDTKFYGGPLWDFDFMSFIRTTQNQWVNKTAGWIPFLWDCPEFRATVKAHWDMYKADFYDIQSRYIDEQERYLLKSAEANWAIHHQNLIDDGRRENGDETLSSTEAIQRMREVLKSRLDWLDARFQDWGNAGGDATIAPLSDDDSDKNKGNFWN